MRTLMITMMIIHCTNGNNDNIDNKSEHDKYNNNNKKKKKKNNNNNYASSHRRSLAEHPVRHRAAQHDHPPVRPEHIFINVC